MKTLSILAFATLFTASSAWAIDAPTPPSKPIVQAQLSKAVTSDNVTGTKISQQDKMRLCSKQATGKKGAERKAFMKTCLSKKA